MSSSTSRRRIVTGVVLAFVAAALPTAVPPALAAPAATSAGAVTLLNAWSHIRVHGVTSNPTVHHYEKTDERDYAINFIGAASGQVTASGVDLHSSASQSTTLLTPGGALTRVSSLTDVSGGALPSGSDTTGKATASSQLHVDFTVTAPTVWRLQASSTVSVQSHPDDPVAAFGVWLERGTEVVLEASAGFNGALPGTVALAESIMLEPGTYRLRVETAGGAVTRPGSSAPALGTVGGTVTFAESATTDLANAVAPSVTGDHRAGQTLVASTGEWVGEPTGFAHQWLRDGQPIPGATSSSYVVTAADAGRSLQVRVTATRPGSLPVEAVSVPREVSRQIFVVKRPKVKGLPTAGKTLKSTKGTWTVEPAKVRYRWLRNGKAVPGADKKTYLVKAADQGSRLRVRVTATRAGHVEGTATSRARKVKVG